MGLASKKNGDLGERRVIQTLRTNGYWVHSVKRNRDGSQPFDVIAVKGNGIKVTVCMLDCKYVAKGKRFPFEDVQPNQIESMDYALRKCGHNIAIGFAIVFAEEADQVSFRFLSHDGFIKMKMEGKKGVNATELDAVALI